VTGKGFTVVAVREGTDTLRMLRNEVVGGAGAGTGNGRDEKPASLGSFRIEAGEWPGCPHCGTTDNSRNAVGLLWVCDRWGCGHPVHCTGSREGRFRCACGIVEERTFVRVETMPVHGSARGPAELGQRGSRAALAAPAGDSLAPPSARLAFRK
jgi:ribosomal protein L37AE/L43A